ncbi:cytochrome P450 [Dictyobacter kobayashii]|uniref:Cytochrome P450 n=1 Tax=Dictyobacter kobayashii TaxID=2014872 RepID=A0A402AR70_9CHLR|nr:cytochrome P450 [Dictyobacter kobayashii]GCE21588.1 cytochrome P450 [Dictyobacter kobayashii]
MDAIQQKVTLPPGPKPLPVLGNNHSFVRDPLDFLQTLHQTYGPLATIYMSDTPSVVLFEPEHIHYVLTENPRNFTSAEFAQNLQEFTGHGLFNLDGDTHRQQRRLVQPAFHRKRVESYADTMRQYTLELLDTWKAGEQIALDQELQQLTMRTVAKCLFNIDLGLRNSNLGQAFADIRENQPKLLEMILKLRINLPFTDYGKRQRGKRIIDEVIYRLIAQRRIEGKDEGDFLSMLLATTEDDQALSDTQIRDHIMTFVAAGHETATNTLSWAIYLLAQNDSEYEKLYLELQSQLHGQPPTLADLAKIPYTEWAINETLRLYPPAYLIGRRARAEFTLDNYTFPAKTNVLISKWVLHRRPDLWEAADEFQPERWRPENAKNIVPWSYIPFGAGPRICIGMPFAQLEMRMLLATILQRFKFRIVPGFKMQTDAVITLRIKNGLQVILEPAP